VIKRLPVIVFLVLLLSAPCFSQVTYDHLPKKYASFSLTSNKWPNTTINYRFRNTTKDYPNCEVAIRLAFAMWSKASGLEFVEVGDQPADITISWKSFGDNNTIAQSSFPTDATEIQFNEDEDWVDAIRDGNSQPLDLVTVAAHEIGHALGLDHSNDKNALMYPTYLKSHRFLDADDVSGIQALYPKENTLLNGGVSFDIKKNRPFTIGSGDFTFDLEFSQAGSNSVYVYDDPATIDGVASVEGASEIEQVADPTSYDMSSRVRTVYEKGLFVLKNNHGYYAIVKLIDVKSTGNTVEPDVSVTLQYTIIPKTLISTWRRTPSVYVSKAREGVVNSFNYTNNSGVFTIGEGEYVFDTMWSGCSSNCIEAYSDKINGVALAVDASRMEQVTDPTRYDRSSRVRTVYKNQILVLRNSNGYYALIRLTDVEDEKSISFSYKILPTKLPSTWRLNETEYVSTPLQGTVTFDLANNNGTFSIGEGKYLFKTNWSDCGSYCVYLYNDLQLQISLAAGVGEINQVTDPEKYQRAKRTISVPVPGVVVLKNSQGRYAIVKVIRVLDERNSTKLTFDYKILPD
jgi:predicted Zn-dependent protease